MTVPFPTLAVRAPDNELYDRGCALVEAATAIRRLADAPEATRAIPAVLGRIKAALHELLWAAAALEETIAPTVQQSSGATEPWARRRSERMQLGYAKLQTALAGGERAAAAARPLAGGRLISGHFDQGFGKVGVRRDQRGLDHTLVGQRSGWVAASHRARPARALTTTTRHHRR